MCEPVRDDYTVEKMKLDFAWNWFDFHAKQRMQLLYFFLIITGILANAFVDALEAQQRMMLAIVCGLGLLQAISFFMFDWRSRILTSHAEDVLEKLEDEHLFPGGDGILTKERSIQMREGDTSRGLCKRLQKMKVWIRALEIFVGIAFLFGFVYSMLLWPEQSITTDEAKPTMTSGRPDPGPQIREPTSSNLPEEGPALTEDE